MSRVWIAVLMFAGVCAQAAPLAEDSCSVLVASGNEPPEMVDVPGLSVLSLGADSPFALSADEGVTIKAVVCWRSEAKLAENDHLVVDAGFPLYIKTDFEDESRNRTLALEQSGGAFRVRLVSGPELSDAEKAGIRQLLALYNARIRDDARATDSNPADMTLSPNAPPDRPHTLSTDDQRQAYERAIAPLVAGARQTWPEAKRRFLEGLPPGHIFFVTARLQDQQGRWETAFIRVQSIKDGVISGHISTDLMVIQAYEYGDAYSLLEADLLDWMIARPDGSEEGNVVGKFLDTYRP